jgi:two-component system, OmpR family, sensor histidine kinase VicK
MSSGAAQLRFAAEFGVFIVAGAGITLLLLRPALLVAAERARPLVGIGFLLLAAASVAHGVGFVDEVDAPSLVIIRLLGILGVSAAAARWPGGATGRLAAWTGLWALAVAEVVLAIDNEVIADWARIIGAAAVGTGVFLAARRSIPVRIATSASAILLAVVLAVSVGLSAVLADNVEDEAANRLASDAVTEANLAEDAGLTALKAAGPSAKALAQSAQAVQILQALPLADPNDPNTALLLGAANTVLELIVADLISVFDPSHGPVLLVSANEAAPQLLASFAPSDAVTAPAVLGQLQANDVVTQAIRDTNDRRSIVVAGTSAYGLAAAPVQPPNTLAPPVAILVVTTPLDANYLAARQELSEPDDGRGLALVSRAGVIATNGEVGSDNALTAVATDAIDSNDRATRTSGGVLLAAEPVRGADGGPVLATVTAVSTATIQETRSDLFELLFLIAIGTTFLALVLAALVGERIGAGLRVLTAAAGEITSGNLAVSPDVRSDDELGVLSDAFSSMTGSLRGMTAELRQAAEEEAQLRTRMEGVVAGMGDALLAVDEHGEVTDFNAAAELLTGVSAGKAFGRPVTQVLKLIGDDGTDLGARVGRPDDEGWSAAGTVRHSAGIDIPVVVSAGILRGAQDQVTGAVYVLRDVRREREIERLKSEFLANISHELRTPLSPIKGYSQIMRTREISKEDVRRFANEIEKASARLERIVVQLVNFASMSAGRFEVRTEPVIVRELLDRVVARWSERLDPARHTVVRRVARGVPKVWLDRQSIDQALDELVDNGVKYSPDGGRIDLTATVGAADGYPVVRLAVSDRGAGIPADRIDDVMGDFTQLDGSVTRPFGGLGLGLALVGRIARAHGGSLELDTAEGKGTVVTLVLPVGGPGGDG